MIAELPLAPAGSDNVRTHIDATRKTSDDGKVRRRIADSGG
jgi:hypothetical protein